MDWGIWFCVVRSIVISMLHTTVYYRTIQSVKSTLHASAGFQQHMVWSSKQFFFTAVYQFQPALGIKISTISKRRKVPTPNHPESCSDFRCLSPIITKFIKKIINVNHVAFPSVIIPELLQLLHVLFADWILNISNTNMNKAQ